MKSMMCSTKVLTKLGIFFMVGCLFLGMSNSCVAHPPAGMKLTYNQTTGVLTVNVAHNSDDLTLHFINRVSILQNDNELEITEDELFSWEEDSQGLIAQYNLSVTEGDEITVTADCSVAGFYTDSIVISFQDGETTNDSTPGFEMVFVVVAVLFGLMLKKRVK